MATPIINIVVYIIVGTVPFLIEMCLFISLLKQFYCNDKEQTINNLFKFTSIMVFVSSIIYGATYNIITWHHEKEWKKAVGGILHFSLMTTAYSIYTILLIRLYCTFQESVYQIRKRQLVIHTMNITISLICFVLSYIYAYNHSYIFVMIWIVSLTMGYTHLLYKFNHNLFLLVLSQTQTNLNKQRTESIELNMRQRIILQTIRKHTILGCFMVFGNCFFALGIQLFFFSSVQYIAVAGYYIFVLTGTLCIYLGITQNRNLYGKCCNYCDRKCESICNRLAEKRLNQQNNEMKMSDE